MCSWLCTLHGKKGGQTGQKMLSNNQQRQAVRKGACEVQQHWVK